MSHRTTAELVAEAKAAIENLSPDQFAKEVVAGDAVIVDLRERDELTASGRIPGAVHIPRGMLEFRADPSSPYHDPSLDPAQRTLLYCASGGRSALAVHALHVLGYDDAAHLEGGFKSWTESGHPIEQD